MKTQITRKSHKSYFRLICTDFRTPCSFRVFNEFLIAFKAEGGPGRRVREAGQGDGRAREVEKAREVEPPELI